MAKRQVYICFVCLFVFAGCKKYENGPLISFKSSTDRIVNTWKIDAVFKNDTEIGKGGKELRFFTFGGEKDFNLTISSVGGTVELVGKWDFIDGEKKVWYIAGSESDTLTILKLTSKKFWGYRMEGDDRIETHFVPRE